MPKTLLWLLQSHSQSIDGVQDVLRCPGRIRLVQPFLKKTIALCMHALMYDHADVGREGCSLLI
jgi:hypothetical protein